MCFTLFFSSVPTIAVEAIAMLMWLNKGLYKTPKGERWASSFRHSSLFQPINIVNMKEELE